MWTNPVIDTSITVQQGFIFVKTSMGEITLSLYIICRNSTTKLAAQGHDAIFKLLCEHKKY